MAMSSVLLDVKPWDDETDMQKLEEAVRSVQMEGLTWGASKLVPVGFGMKKLQILMTIVDDLVSVDALIEDTLTQEPISEYVQSCDIVAFNKICCRIAITKMAMSSVLLDVKPWDDETDMQKLEEAVRSVQMEGLTWGASKLVPVGFGMKKLQILMTIVDDLVSVDAIIEDKLTQEPISEYVQSCDIVAFNKISMVPTFYVGSEAGLKKLDEYLLSRSYITGYQASKDDLTVHAAFTKPPSPEYVNVSRWYNHITALLRISDVFAEGNGVIVEKYATSPEEAIATPPAAADEDDDSDVDLFGEETEEEKKAAEERAAAVKASGKKKESGKSSVLLDVKPWDDETDMQKLEEAVRSVQMEGLTWGASKLVPVGYGIKKLQIMMTIVDDLVSVDSIIEDKLTQEPINEYVQSCDIVAFNKISKLVPVGYGIKKLQIMMTIVDDLVSVDSIIEDKLTQEPINEYVQSCDIVAFNKICKFILNHSQPQTLKLQFHNVSLIDYRNSDCRILNIRAELLGWISMSLVLLEVHPFEADADMQKLDEAVRSVKMVGLVWGASRVLPIAYGVEKLQIMMRIIDDLVSVNAIIDILTQEPINEYVQSAYKVPFVRFYQKPLFLSLDEMTRTNSVFGNCHFEFD
ncbi:hypothetical protein CTI12_AA095430 [Artemisia annua]|uniref:Translation elongation factor EF1B beta/delta subunit guanine nucleotide exchange domain-containing protein n=1 Tax=Artemisia annua TaxID=35608 RepID=A0A2U1PYQ9_ARTAN|nr:hypothetical protein CTI12_AA095430 [Artemisia annua]